MSAIIERTRHTYIHKDISKFIQSCAVCTMLLQSTVGKEGWPLETIQTEEALCMFYVKSRKGHLA